MPASYTTVGEILYQSNVSEHVYTVKKNLLTQLSCAEVAFNDFRSPLQQAFPAGYLMSVYLEVAAWSFALSLLSGYAHFCERRLLLGGDTHIEGA
jgi:hypothetical protein